ncbi:hypothetical protein EC844_11118 [Acinetobacter calcoaceticus]|uniref:Lipoprotein n=1 Tax=Acinetobacter calcoaceticus TaxID=471 RepID=A0A4R1XT25_ACICA|nr:hypothetical protein EC844_11118 [Acinetobacter calcoaceticus]
MLFKKIAIAAAVVTTLAFVGCTKKAEDKAPDAATAASEVQATSEVAAMNDAASTPVEAVASTPAEAAASTPVVDAPAASQ